MFFLRLCEWPDMNTHSFCHGSIQMLLGTIASPDRWCSQHHQELWKLFQRPSAYRCISSSICVPFPCSLHENITSLLWGVCVRHQDSLFHGCYSVLFHYLSDTPTPRFIQSETEMHPSLCSSVFPPGSNIRRSKNVSQGNLRHFRTSKRMLASGERLSFIVQEEAANSAHLCRRRCSWTLHAVHPE